MIRTGRPPGRSHC